MIQNRPKPTSLTLLRHGETLGGARFNGSTDVALTQLGWNQMWAAVAEEKWDQIITSPLGRCAEFATALSKLNSTPMLIDQRIQEMHFGLWEGKTSAELFATDADALTRFWSDPLRNSPPQGEPLPEFAARLLAAWQDIVTKFSGKKVLVVTHGGVIRTLLCHHEQRPFEQLLSYSIGHGHQQTLQIAEI